MITLSILAGFIIATTWAISAVVFLAIIVFGMFRDNDNDLL